MTKPLTIRLEVPDYERLEDQAMSLGMRPGTLAKVLLHASLTQRGSPQSEAAIAALERLAAFSIGRRPVGAADLVQAARRGLRERM